MSESLTASPPLPAPPEQGEKRVYATLLTVTAAPHVRTRESIARIMWTVSASLAPVVAWAVYQFGWRALAQVVVAGGACALTEAGIQRFRGIKITWRDGSAFLTGLLLACCIPVGLPLWMTALGAVFSMGVAKHTFGGLGQNIFNPAHAGRAFLLASFPVPMTTWTVLAAAKVDGITTATPLGLLKEGSMQKVLDTFGGRGELYTRLFLGNVNGSLGEVSTLLLLLGGLFLVYKRYIFWQGPVFYIGTVALLTALAGGDPVFAVLSGGLVIGAFYMLTDMVTSPVTAKGQIIFAVGAGVLVFLIRTFGGYPEGVCYSILLMNCFTPLIDRLVKPTQFKEATA